MKMIRIAMAVTLSMVNASWGARMGDEAGDGGYLSMFYNSGTERSPNIREVPRPVLDEHPGWIDLYYRTWDLAAANIHRGTEENGFVERYMDEAFGPGLNQWDMCFVMMFAKYGNGKFPGIVTLENFYRRQHGDGFISRTLYEPTGRDKQDRESPASINPPLFSWAEWENYQITGDASRFMKAVTSQAKTRKGELGPEVTKPIFERLCDYYLFVKNNRRHGPLYWQSNMGSGLDNSPAYAYPKPSKQYWTVCLSSQQAQNAWYLARIAEVVGDKEKQEFFTREHQELKDLVNGQLWNDQDKIYYNKDSETVWRRVKYVCGFWPMIARVPDAAQVDSLVGHLQDAASFNRPMRVPTLAADHPAYAGGGGYWKGAVWAPTNYQVVKGLEAYGRYGLAKEISESYIAGLYKEYLESNSVWENYNAEKPRGNDKKDMVGWTGVGPIALLIENIIGIQCNARENQIYWVVTSPERNGIEQFNFNGGTIKSMICAKRSLADSPAVITIDAEKEFTLICRIGDLEYSQIIRKGRATYTFGK